MATSLSSQPPPPPSQDRIVCLDECYCEIPSFSIAHIYTGHDSTPPKLTAERIRDATIVITTRAPISGADLELSPNVRLIAVMAAGYEIIDLEACRQRGITVCNIPSASAEAVAEHALTLYLAVKRRIVELHAFTKEGLEWPLKKTAVPRFGGLPKTCRKETMGIVGYGTLGKRLEIIAKALNMSVLVAERKAAGADSIRSGRTAFLETLKTSSVVILCCPLDGTTRGMIGEAELRHMGKDSILINVSRGGVVDEAALVTALKEHWIKGAATDVFAIEPASAFSSPLLADGIPNLTLSPHVAWCGESSLENLKRSIKSNIEGFVQGKPENLI